MSDNKDQAEHDDAVLDAIALVTAIIADDTDGCGVILRNCDKAAVMVTMSKLLAAAVADNTVGIGVCDEPACLRAWAAEAVNRP